MKRKKPNATFKDILDILFLVQRVARRTSWPVCLLLEENSTYHSSWRGSGLEQNLFGMKPQGLEMAGLRKDGKEAIKSKTRENRNLIFLTLSLEGGLPAAEAGTLPTSMWMSNSKKSSRWHRWVDWNSQLHFQIHFIFSVSFLTLYRIPKHWQMQTINMDSLEQFSQSFILVASYGSWICH